MASGKSPMTRKQELADKRERKVRNRPNRDDGFLRRHDKEPMTAAEVRALSRAKDVFVPAWVRYKHELFVRKQMGKAWSAERDEIIPLKGRAPGGEYYVGKYQEGDK
jgi:hypothetical protein